MISTSVENLILQLGQGKTGAFEELYKETKASVYGLALSILKKPQDAEDVMHDTYLKVYRGAGSYKAQGKPMAWLLRITRNLALDRLRLKSSEETSMEEDRVASDEKDFTESTIDKILLDRLMKQLPDIERQIVILHSVTGLKHREIAEILEIPLATSLSKYHRSLSKLRKMLEEAKK